MYIFSEFCLPMKLVALINVLNEMSRQDQVYIYIFFLYIYFLFRMARDKEMLY
jgi:hypothetical protein